MDYHCLKYEEDCMLKNWLIDFFLLMEKKNIYALECLMINEMYGFFPL